MSQPRSRITILRRTVPLSQPKRPPSGSDAAASSKYSSVSKPSAGRAKTLFHQLTLCIYGTFQTYWFPHRFLGWTRVDGVLSRWTVIVSRLAGSLRGLTIYDVLGEVKVQSPLSRISTLESPA